MIARLTGRASAKAGLSDPRFRCGGGSGLSDKSYPGDNRLVTPKSSYRRRGSAPRCRLITSWGWRKLLTSLSDGNIGVINKLKTEEARFCRSQIFWYSVNMVGSVGKGCSEVDRAYIAGLFDCDGAIMATIESHKEKKFKFRIRVILKLTQKNPQLLQWISNLLGIGHIYKNRTTSDWIVKDQQQCKELLEMIQFYSRGKQSQIKLALEIFKISINSESDLIKIARLADTLSSFNVRSFGRRKNYASKIQEHTSSND